MSKFLRPQTEYLAALIFLFCHYIYLYITCLTVSCKTSYAHVHSDFACCSLFRRLCLLSWDYVWSDMFVGVLISAIHVQTLLDSHKSHPDKWAKQQRWSWKNSTLLHMYKLRLNYGSFLTHGLYLFFLFCFDLKIF